MTLNINGTTAAQFQDIIGSTPVSEPAFETEQEQLPPIASVVEKNKDDCLERIVELYNAYKNWRTKEVEMVWDAVYRSYRGFKPMNPHPYRIIYTIRESFRQIETLKPQLSQFFFGGDELFEYVARHAGFEENAAAATEIVHMQIRRYHLEEQLQTWLDTAVLYGTCHLIYGWHKFKHSTRKLTSLHAADIKPIWERKTTEKLQEAPWVEAMKPWEVFVHPFIEDPRNSPAVFIRKSVSVADIKTYVREGWLSAKVAEEAVDDAAGGMGMISLAESRLLQTSPQYDVALDKTAEGERPHEMIICWSSDGWEYVLLDQRHIMRGQVLPYPEIPIVTLRNYPQIGEHYGIPELLVIMEDQRLLNDFMSLYADSVHYTLNPMFKVKRSAKEDWTFSTFKPGGAIYLDDMDAVQPLQVNPYSTDLARAGQFVMNNMKLATGLTDELAGTGSSQRTATGLVRLQDAAGARMQHKVRVFLPAFRDIYRILYDLNALYLSEDIAVRLEGKDGGLTFKRFGPNIFEADVDISTEVAGANDVGPQAQQKWQTAYQMMAQDPMINGVELRKQVLRALGIKKVKQFLVDPAQAQTDALAENDDLLAFGVVADPKISDNHQTHIQIHGLALRAPQLLANPAWAQELIKHIQLHAGYLQQQQQQVAMAAQAQSSVLPQAGAAANSGVQNEANARTEAMFGNAGAGAAQNLPTGT